MDEVSPVVETRVVGVDVTALSLVDVDISVVLCGFVVTDSVVRASVVEVVKTVATVVVVVVQSCHEFGVRAGLDRSLQLSGPSTRPVTQEPWVRRDVTTRRAAV